MANARCSETRYDCDLSGIQAARHFVRDALLRWDLPTLVDDASLGVSELVANAVQHAGTEFAVRVDVSDRVLISVVDGHSELDLPDPVGGTQQSPGLLIVATIAADWGVTPLPGGKAVWFALPLPDAVDMDADLVALAQPRIPSDRKVPAAGAPCQVQRSR